MIVSNSSSVPMTVWTEPDGDGRTIPEGHEVVIEVTEPTRADELDIKIDLDKRIIQLFTPAVSLRLGAVTKSQTFR